MADDLKTFGAKMRKVSQAIILDVNEMHRSIVKHVHSDVVSSTPVDVGTARSNWVVRANSPFSLLYNAYSPHASRWKPPYADPGSNLSETANREAAERQAAGVLGRVGAQPSPLPTIYIANNLPYITALNQGHSKQAPAGFVQSSVQSGLRSAVTLFRFTNIESLF